ncbi:Phosphoribosylamine--glycine ligase [hydrothermal vent metagenome]|uniref:Phosphoribosylamine--glycine ligase n=1 Tax=hydrothermal vent metagenome TaxID=652676 RepID=A0A1W1CHH0_9ZZZZ
MNILIIGNGGREHALAWQCAKFNHNIFVAPGNAGTQLENNIQNINIAVDDINSLIDFAKKNTIDLTIVGPEAPLVLGVVDAFQKHNLKIFGPSKDASQLEGSKAFSKDFMIKHNIPTAFYGVFTDIKKAHNYIKKQGVPIVIKADGLAAGKGVIIAQSEQEALDTVTNMLEGNQFGNAGHRVVIEEFLTGEEASFIVMADGKNALAMATSQDHKARDNGDKGPNTGGMGAYSPAPIVNDKLHKKIMTTVIQPTIDGMAKDNMPYTGFLYAGLMIDKQDNIKVLEYNCRFGDPETQPIMMRLKSDLVELCLLALNKNLHNTIASWDNKTALGVVLSAKGYPNKFKKNEIITLPQTDSNNKIFHAGTKLENSSILSNGGRVLCATALGKDVKLAQKNAYELVDKINWDGAYYRTDIGFKAL